MPIAVPHEDILAAKYDFSSSAIRSSTQISKRALALVSHFGAQQAESDSAKTMIVAIQASIRAVNKLVSIIEITKRELQAQGRMVFQYTALSSELQDSKRNTMEIFDYHDTALNEESDDAFDFMKGSNETSIEQRPSPVLTIYIASASVKELQNAYGEQWN